MKALNLKKKQDSSNRVTQTIRSLWCTLCMTVCFLLVLIMAKNKIKKDRVVNFDEYGESYIAFKFSYIGYNY